MDIAKGEWIVFVDADDFWLYDNVLSTFATVIEKSDCEVVRAVSALNSVYRFQSKGHFIGGITPKEINGKDYFTTDTFSYEIWSGIYRKDLLTEKDIRFVEGMMYEDTAWNTKLMRYAQNVVLIDFPFYGYYVNPISTTRGHCSIAPFRDNARSCLEVRNVLENCKDNGFVVKGYSRIKGTLLSLVRQSRNFPLRQSVEVMKWLKHNQLLDTRLYNLSLKERVLFLTMKHAPTVLLATVKALTLLKRFLRSGQ